MQSSLIFVVVTLALLIAVEMLYIPVARRRGWTTRNNERLDGHPVTVIGGGIIFYIGMVLWSLGMSAVYGEYAPGAYFLIGLTMLAATSFADDLLCLPVWLRLVVQFVAVGFMCFSFPILDISPWLLVVYLFIVAGFVNGYNFMDGINGMTAAYSTVVLGMFLYINQTALHFGSGSMMAVALGSALIFGFFNFRRHALAFAGDVGSISMGFIVSLLMTEYILVSGQLSALGMVAVYITDITLTILRRLIEGENIFRAHRKHIYERLHFVWGVRQLYISGIYSALQLFISVVWLLMPSASWRNVWCLATYGLLILCYMTAMHFTERRLRSSAA